MKKLIVAAMFLFFVFVFAKTDVLASRNDDDRRSTPRPTRTATPAPTPTNRPSDNHHDDRHDHDRDDRHDDRDDDCEETNTPHPTQTPVPSPTPTVLPTVTPTPIATINPDVCPNLDGIQTSLPDEYHFDTAHYNCLKFELGGPSQPSEIGGANVLGVSTINTGQVLGVSTMASTGSFDETFFYSLFSVGSLLTSVGIMKNGKKKSN